MLAGLNQTRDRGTEHSEHTAISPVVPFPMPTGTPTSHDTGNNPSFEDFCSAKETYFCTTKLETWSWFLMVLDLLKLEKRRQEEKLLSRSL